LQVYIALAVSCFDRRRIAGGRGGYVVGRPLAGNRPLRGRRHSWWSRPTGPPAGTFAALFAYWTSKDVGAMLCLAASILAFARF